MAESGVYVIIENREGTICTAGSLFNQYTDGPGFYKSDVMAYDPI
jgi:hypothetical protein